MLRLFRHYVGLPAVFLALCETTIFFAILTSISYAGIFDSFTGGINSTGNISAAAAITLVAILAMSAVGMYNREVFFRIQFVISRAAITFPIIFFAFAFLTFLYSWAWDGRHNEDYYSYYALCMAGLLVYFPVLIASRQMVNRVTSLDTFKRRIVVIGTGERAAKIDRLNHELGERGFLTVGFIHLGTPREGDPRINADRRAEVRRPDFWLAPEALPQFVKENRIDEIVVASEERRGMPVWQLLNCKLLGVQVTDYATFWERESGQVDLDAISPSWLVFSDGFRHDALRLASKRLFDIAVSLLLLLLTLPVTIPTALLIRLESPGPIFYRQERVGLYGRSIMVLKFRSMRADAEKDGPQWAKKNDSRVTRIGAVIRKTRIDEIPQVINVLKGDMSFIGPRPERPVFVQDLAKKIPYYNERHWVKPGITGWAQINFPYGASDEDAKQKLSYDLYYLKNGSMFLDAIVLLQTVRVILWNEGAR